MRKWLAKLLAFILLFETISFQQQMDVFAAALNFGADMKQTMDERLNVIEDKGLSSDDIFIYWDFNSFNGSGVTTGTYELKYNLDDYRTITFTIDKYTNYAEISYRILDHLTGVLKPFDISSFTVYKDQTAQWVFPDTLTLPNITPTYGVVYNTFTDLPDDVDFIIEKDTGFAFNYDNKTVRFRWADDSFFFVTDGATLGSIYPFELTTTVSGVTDTQTIEIFPGVSGVTSQPTAEPRVTQTTGWEELPYPSEDPAKKPGILFSFDQPKQWNDTMKEFQYINTPLQAIIEMYEERTGGFVITIPDLTDTSTPPNVIPGGDMVPTIFNNQFDIVNNRIQLDIRDLWASTLFDSCFVTVAPQGWTHNSNTFYTVDLSIERGTVYTYLKYIVEAYSADSYYIKVYPYYGYSGFYTVYSGALPLTVSRWSEVEDKSNGKETLEIPIVMSPNGYWFKVDFTMASPDGTPNTSQAPLESQYLEAKPNPNALVLPSPNNLDVVPTMISENGANYLILDITWDIAHDYILEVLRNTKDVTDVTYYFNKSLLDGSSNDIFAMIQVNLSNIKENMTMQAASGHDPDVQILDWDFIFSTELVNGDYEDLVQGYVQLKIPAKNLKEPNSPGERYYFYYPNVYSIYTWAEYIFPNDPDPITRFRKTNKSNIVNITIDAEDNLEVPPPQDFYVVEDSITRYSFEVTWRTVNSAVYGTYEQNMLKPKGYEIRPDSVSFNLYISQNLGSIDQIINGDSSGISIQSARYTTVLDFSNLALSDGRRALEALRAGEVVKIEGITQDNWSATRQYLELLGLDANQIYYLCMETIIWPYDSVTGIKVPAGDDNIKTSQKSNIVTATTKPEPETPGTEDKTPEAPTNFRIEEQGNGYVKLYWDKMDQAMNIDNAFEVVEYQLHKTVGEPANSTSLNERDVYGTFLNKQPAGASKTGILTDDTRIYEYRGSSFSVQITEDYTYDNYSSRLGNYITDYTLLPNTVVYYYLRVVLKNTQTGAEVYSIWVPANITTEPIKAPINLEIVREGVTFDPKNSVFVGFDAPITDLSQLGAGIDIQYQLKRDTDDWGTPMKMDASQLKNNASASDLDGYTYFTYKITNLDPGRLYSIRVRMVDNNFGDFSLWSNTVTYKTTGDPGTDQDDERVKGYEKIYDDLLYDILRRHYWILRESSNIIEWEYRGSMFDAQLAQNTSGLYTIGDSGSRNQTIYIPSYALNSANSSNTGFTMMYDAITIALQADALDPNVTESIRDMATRIKNKDIQDYYVKITVVWTDSATLINGEQPIGPTADVTITIVGSKILESVYDQDVEDEFYKLFNDAEIREDVRESLLEGVEDDDNETEMMKIVKDLVSDFEKDLSSFARSHMSDTTRYNYEVIDLETPLVLSIVVEQPGAAVNGYSYDSGWVLQTITRVGNRAAMNVFRTGTFVFTGKIIVIPGLSEMDNADAIMELIIKYSLDDYLGKDSININANATHYMITGTVARLGGAPQGADSTVWLQEKGVRVRASQMQSTVSQQEGVYYIMSLYEIKSGRKVSTIHVTNYGAFSNTTGLSADYKPYVQGAYELGLIDDSMTNAKSNMRVKDFLEILGELVKTGNY